MTVNFDDLVNCFRELGVSKGDVLLVHSSYKSFGEVEGGPEIVIKALLEILTEIGTLIVPTFNYDFCEGKPFDVLKTPSKMGIITKIIMENSESKRTLDPVFSFSIMGKHRDYLANLRYTHSFGTDSMFAKLRELNAKIMIIGLLYNPSMTFFHHVEEMKGCDYRYFKEFQGEITDHNRDVKQGKIVLYVRDIDRGVTNSLDEMGFIMEKEGIIKKKIIGNSEVKLMKAREVFERTTNEMEKNPHILTKIKKEI